MHGNHGFTLVELLVTLAVAVILITLAAPSFQTLIDNNRRAAQVNEFVSALTYARSEALKRGNNVGLCRAADYNAATPTCGSGSGWEDGWILFSDENSQNGFDAGDIVLRRYPPLTGNQVTLRGNSNVQDNILYSRNGTVAGANNGSIFRCDHRGAGSDARVIVLSRTGRVRVSDQGITNCTPGSP